MQWTFDGLFQALSYDFVGFEGLLGASLRLPQTRDCRVAVRSLCFG